MPINAHPDFLKAEQEYLTAETKQQKIIALKKMISHAPSHKGAENLRAQLKRRLAKLKYTNEKEIKKTSSSKKGIKKADMQAVIIGETNTGKSLLLSTLTNAKPKIASSPLELYTTTKPILGTMNFQGCQIQIIENPAIESEHYDRGLTHTADTLIIIVNNLEQLEKASTELQNNRAKKIIVFHPKDQQNTRKLEATLKSKKNNFVILPPGSLGAGDRGVLEELKEKIFRSFSKIRVYTKEPGKNPDKNKPIILEPNSTVKHAAEKILHGFSSKIRQTKIWGPSSKFPGQTVGLKHKLKDLDIVEFKTKG